MYEFIMHPLVPRAVNNTLRVYFFIPLFCDKIG